MNNIGKRIKNLRTKAGLTQDKLANQLGVSFQSVSKWENGITMPDITYLPLLSSIFGVSIDSLFGIDNPAVERRIDEVNSLITKTRDIKKRIELARELCKEFPTHKKPKFILFNQLSCHFATEEENKEAIELGYRLLDGITTDEQWEKESIIWDMVAILPEEKLDVFLNKYTVDTLPGNMLARRYMYRDEKEKWLIQYQINMYTGLRYYFIYFLSNLLTALGKEQAGKHCRARIRMLNALTEAECPTDSVIGDGEVDIFVIWRIRWGIALAAFADCGTEAIDVLNDVMLLYSKLEDYPEDMPINNRSGQFAAIEIYHEYDKENGDNLLVPTISEIGIMGIDKKYIKRELESSFFDWLRKNEEFKRIIDKL